MRISIKLKLIENSKILKTSAKDIILKIRGVLNEKSFYDCS